MAKKTHNVYVIKLDPKVLGNKKFLNDNPNYNEEKTCYYVGMTGLDLDERYANHKRGYKYNKFVREFGRWLSRRKFEKLNPMTYKDAVKMEDELAKKLRIHGHAV